MTIDSPIVNLSGFLAQQRPQIEQRVRNALFELIDGSSEHFLVIRKGSIIVRFAAAAWRSIKVNFPRVMRVIGAALTELAYATGWLASKAWSATKFTCNWAFENYEKIDNLMELGMKVAKFFGIENFDDLLERIGNLFEALASFFDGLDPGFA